MRTGRIRTLSGCLLSVAVLTLSACYARPDARPSATPTQPVEWVSDITTSADASVVIDKVSYMSGDLEIQGQVCRPVSDGPHPVIIANHGGFGGLSDWDNPRGFCALAAQGGFVLAESSYRGEDGSDGKVEVCLGEVDDVLAMLKIVRTQDYADPHRIAMLGMSHGGCITSKAVERGVDVDAAVAIAGPRDWAPLVRAARRAVQGPTPNPAVVQQISQVEDAIGGSPDKVPGRYAKRTPDPKKIARWGKPFLIMHGAADSIVPVKQSCSLAKDIGGFQAYRIGASGKVVPHPPPGCGGGLTWKRGPKPVHDFPGDRYLMVYDGVDHLLAANGGMQKVTTDFLQFIRTKLNLT